MKKLLNYALVPVILLLVGCQKDIQTTLPELVADAKGAAAPAKLSAVALKVTVSNQDGIANDGKGIYTDGVQSTTATIRNTDGQFFFTVDARYRWLTFPFRRELEGKDDYRMVTDCPIALQNMAIGSANAQMAGFRVWAYTGRGVLAWNMRYDYNASGNGNPETDKVLITRVSSTRWTIQTTNNNKAELMDSNGNFIDYFSVPAFITLDTK